MKLTLFGKAVRNLRITYDIPLKTMAEAMEISSAYLSSMEYGDKKLSEKHLQAAIDFFSDKATPPEISALRKAGEQSMDVVSTATLTPDARGLVAAFARRLQEGRAPTPEIENWINSRF